METRSVGVMAVMAVFVLSRRGNQLNGNLRFLARYRKNRQYCPLSQRKPIEWKQNCRLQGRRIQKVLSRRGNQLNGNLYANDLISIPSSVASPLSQRKPIEWKQQFFIVMFWEIKLKSSLAEETNWMETKLYISQIFQNLSGPLSQRKPIEWKLLWVI